MDDTPRGAADLYDDVLSDDEKEAARERAAQQVDEVERTLVREHYEISHRPVLTDADRARLEEIDGILADRRAAHENR